MPAAAEERLLEYARAWNTRGVRAWEEGWWEMSLTVGDQIARLIGAPPGSVSMHQNVTIAEAVVVSCFGFEGPRRRIVYEEGNFPSVRYLYQAQRGADILVAADEEGVVEAIDERTLLVPVTHVLYKTGEIRTSSRSCQGARGGALVVLDAYQSVGTVPLDDRARVDFAVGGSVKWLCGGPGAAWLYVRPDLGDARARAHRLAGACTAVRLRARAGLRRRRRALPDRYAERARALRGDGRLRHRRGGRHRAGPPALAGADGAAGRAAG
jgi:kynureninase